MLLERNNRRLYIDLLFFENPPERERERERERVKNRAKKVHNIPLRLWLQYNNLTKDKTLSLTPSPRKQNF